MPVFPPVITAVFPYKLTLIEQRAPEKNFLDQIMNATTARQMTNVEIATISSLER